MYLSVRGKSNSKYIDPNNPEAQFYEIFARNSPQTFGFKYQGRDTGITVDSKSWIPHLSLVIYSVQYPRYLFMFSLASKPSGFSKEIVTLGFCILPRESTSQRWYVYSLPKS